MPPQRAPARRIEPGPAEVERPRLRVVGLPPLEEPHPDVAAGLLALAGGRRTVERGSLIYRSGDRLTSLFVVQSGLFKTCLSLEDGRSQVTGFQLSGEWLGLDSIGSGRHHSDAVALEDATVCTIGYEELEDRLLESGELRHQFQRLMSREIVRGHDMMLLLGSMCAEVRVATFLLDLTQRMHARGSPATSVVLRMTRDEMGSYLGLKLETVSRLFSRFQTDRLIEVQQKHVRILDSLGLKALLAS